MARVCANTLEGNIQGTHQQHGLGISLHLHSKAIKLPSEVHHKPCRIRYYCLCNETLDFKSNPSRIAIPYVVVFRFHEKNNILLSQLGNCYASWSEANVASASEVISWIHQWWPTKTRSDILSTQIWHWLRTEFGAKKVDMVSQWISVTNLVCLKYLHVGSAVHLSGWQLRSTMSNRSETFQKHGLISFTFRKESCYAYCIHIL